MSRKNVVEFPKRLAPAVRQPGPALILVLPVIRIERYASVETDARVRRTLRRLRRALKGPNHN